MFKKIIENVHNLEDLLVECAEMAHFNEGMNSLLINKNEAYLKEKKANDERATVDLASCEMYRYLSTT
ncbi:hypothetical protein IJE86_10755 [bacterium]|nr:hypothetical protein [bacterium]